MYLHHILSRENKELIHRIYAAQKENPTQGDFADQVKEDLTVLEMTEDSIATLTKGALKTLMKEKVNAEAEKFLKKLQVSHKKVNLIHYKELKIQQYMVDKRMTNSMVEVLVAARSSMVRGIRQNFASLSQRTQCPLLCKDTARDTQQHLLECPVLLAALTIKEEEQRDAVRYDDIFGGVEMQLRITPVLMRLLEIREELIEARPTSGLKCWTQSTLF